jgi:hypothetical protein
MGTKEKIEFNQLQEEIDKLKDAAVGMYYALNAHYAGVITLPVGHEEIQPESCRVGKRIWEIAVRLDELWPIVASKNANKDHRFTASLKRGEGLWENLFIAVDETGIITFPDG